jgi:hypothetical protein
VKLLQLLSLWFGGPGSGCHGENCGRKPGDSEARSQRARDSWVPYTQKANTLARGNEKKIADLVGGEFFPGHPPFDVVIHDKKIAIEVKTMIGAKNDKLTVHPGTSVSKKDYVKEHGIQKTYTVALDHRNCSDQYHETCSPTVYFKEGTGAFRLSTMKKLSGLDEICQHVECAK